MTALMLTLKSQRIAAEEEARKSLAAALEQSFAEVLARFWL